MLITTIAMEGATLIMGARLDRVIQTTAMDTIELRSLSIHSMGFAKATQVIMADIAGSAEFSPHGVDMGWGPFHEVAPMVGALFLEVAPMAVARFL
jgi:hypothetical protein